MRVVGLFALTILFPVFAHAVALININTADEQTLDDGLPGVGPSTAASIIANRPYTSIEDISRADGIGPPGSSSYEKIKDLITVGDTSTADAGTASSTPESTTASQSGAPPEYIPIPTLRIITGGDRTVSSGADTAFTAVVYDGRGNKRDDAMITWSFGDGMRRTGASVYHKYYDSGEYAAVVRATTSDGGDARSEIIMTVKNAGIKISSVSSRGITLANTDSRTLDISLWRLSMGEQEFKIPEDTQILAGRMTLFPSQIIQLPISNTASLLYPSGEVATTYPVVQPSVPAASYEKVQKVEQIISANTNIQTNDEAVNAPAAANELAAAGAALPLASLPRADSIFRSPGFLGLLGVIALAGSAFIFF